MIARARYAAFACAAVQSLLLGCGSAPDDAKLQVAGQGAEAPKRAEAAASASIPAGAAASRPVASSERGEAPGRVVSGAAGSSAPPDASGSATVTETADEIVDPTGVWWTEAETIGSEVLPWLGQLDGTKIRFVMRVDVSGSAPENIVKFEFCQLQTEWTDPMDPANITTIGFRPNTVAAFSETRTIDLGGLRAGDSVPLPSLEFRGGTDESGMQIDDDSDGNPAVTAWVRTLLGIEIEVFETITIPANLTLTAPDADTLMGTLDFSADALIISSNNVIIGAGTPVTITPDSKAVPVTVKRLPGGAGTDCTALPSTIQFTTVPPPPPVLIPPPEPAP
jgi:hypothetical protein